MTVYETLTLMISFSILVLLIIGIKKYQPDNKKLQNLGLTNKNYI